MPVKTEEEAYDKIIMSWNNDYQTDYLQDFAYFKQVCRLIAINLSKQTKLKDDHQIDFIGRFERQERQQQWSDGVVHL